MEFSEGLKEELKLTAERPEVREARISHLSRKLHRAKCEALADESEWRRLAEKLADHGGCEGCATCNHLKWRVRVLHCARCSKIRVAAYCAREIVRYVAGDLRIDETTSGTGLDEEERRLVSDVAGVGVDGW